MGTPGNWEAGLVLRAGLVGTFSGHLVRGWARSGFGVFNGLCRTGLVGTLSGHLVRDWARWVWRF